MEYNGSHPTQGRVKKKHIPIILYEKKNNPTQCLVHLYQKYLSLRPIKECPDDFYLRPSGNPKLDPLLFRNQAVGRHSLCQTIQRLMTSAGYVGCYSGSSIQTVHVNVSGAKYGDRRSSKIMEYPPKHTASHSSIISPSLSDVHYLDTHAPPFTGTPVEGQGTRTDQYHLPVPNENSPEVALEQKCLNVTNHISTSSSDSVKVSESLSQETSNIFLLDDGFKGENQPFLTNGDAVRLDNMSNNVSSRRSASYNILAQLLTEDMSS